MIKPGQVCDSPVGGVDLIPTFFRHAGIELPWDMHGFDLTPLFKNPKAKWDHPVIISFQERQYGSDTRELPDKKKGSSSIPWYVSISKGKYKYIRYLLEDELDELYQRDNDPDELKNEILNPEYKEVIARLRAELTEELKRTDAPFVDIMPKTRTQ